MSSPKLTREERFRDLYNATYGPVLRFSRRRLGLEGWAVAHDVVAETFLVAWRRIDEVPGREGEALAWTYAVARNCLLNAQRSGQRQDALAVRIMTVSPPAESVEPAGSEADLRLDLAAAWQLLTAEDQEVLALVLFEDLSSGQAARVLGISAAGYRMRLSRARRALHLCLDRRPARRPAPLRATTTTAQENS